MVSKTENDDQTESLSFYEDTENLKKLCNFLLSGEGPSLREALLMEKRVLYLKGGLYCIYVYTYIIQCNTKQ